jgi:hypothetical protein
VEEFSRRLAIETKRLQEGDGIDRLERQRRNARARSWVDPRACSTCRASSTRSPGYASPPGSTPWCRRMFGEAVPDGCPDDPIEKQRYLTAQATRPPAARRSTRRHQPAGAAVDTDRHRRPAPADRHRMARAHVRHPGPDPSADPGRHDPTGGAARVRGRDRRRRPRPDRPGVRVLDPRRDPRPHARHPRRRRRHVTVVVRNGSCCTHPAS